MSTTKAADPRYVPGVSAHDDDMTDAEWLEGYGDPEPDTRECPGCEDADNAAHRFDCPKAPADDPPTDWEALTLAASERAGYAPETWRTTADVVRAALETERERYESNARHLRDALTTYTQSDGPQTAEGRALATLAGRLLDDLGVTEGYA